MDNAGDSPGEADTTPPAGVVAPRPVYRPRPRALVTRRPRRNIGALLDVVFILIALVCAGWLAVRLLAGSLSLTGSSIILVIGCYILLAYLLLPRLHQVFTVLYVPDYFIGRTRTSDGLLGDPVNLAFDGTEDDLQTAMTLAGWTRADDVTIGSALRIISSTLLRRTYREAPVSDLLLFGRRQDFAYQQEVGGDASRRHHVRFWRVPEGWLLPGGQRVDWVAAGTYDRSVGFSLFTGQVTHKIDPDTDAERDYIVDTLNYAIPDLPVRVIEDFSTAYHSRNGGGDAIHTDGDLPIVDVNAVVADDHVLPAPRDESTVAQHRIPPASLLVVGLLTLLRLLQLLTVVPQALALADQETAQERALVVTAAVVVFCLGALFSLLLWVLTVARKGWARMLLMVLLTFESIQALLLPVDFHHRLTGYGLIALSVLSLLALSGSSTRDWVRAGGRRARRS